MDGTMRSGIFIGRKVGIVQKHHQASGTITKGTVVKILTNAPNHSQGIKVMIENGIIGRVKEME